MHPDNISLAFVTGNYNKLKETKYILSQGTPVDIDSQDLDSKFFLSILVQMLIKRSSTRITGHDPRSRHGEMPSRS
jgi:hypothetical protein